MEGDPPAISSLTISKMQLRTLRIHGTPLSQARGRGYIARCPQRYLRVYCAKEDSDKEKEKAKTTEARFAEQLKKQGFKKENAQRILQLWREGGSQSPEELRKMFLRGSLRPLSVVLFQLVLDAGATYGSFVAAASIGALPGLPVPILFSAAGTLAGFYFLTSTAFDIVTIGSILFSIYRFGTNAEAFLKALESIAGGTDITVIGKAKTIVDIFKVIQALNQIADVLKVINLTSKLDSGHSQEKGTGEISTLESLSAYLTLSHAENNYGFKPEKYGLSEKEATNIAVVFSRYDQNEDGVLQTSELGSLVYLTLPGDMQI